MKVPIAFRTRCMSCKMENATINCNIIFVNVEVRMQGILTLEFHTTLYKLKFLLSIGD